MASHEKYLVTACPLRPGQPGIGDFSAKPHGTDGRRRPLQPLPRIGRYKGRHEGRELAAVPVTRHIMGCPF